MTPNPTGAVNFRQPLPGLYRSANLVYLSKQGREDLLGLGLSRIIDLRTRAEREKDPPPFLGRSEYLNLSLLPYRNRAFNIASVQRKNNADYSIQMFDHCANQIVSVLGAIHDAPPGPVLVHCHAGKDRTGQVVALCLELAGKTREEIVTDYIQTGAELIDFYAEMKARTTPEQWAKIEPFVPCTPDDVLRPLAYLDEEWGGLNKYLAAYGFSEREQAVLAARLNP